MKEVVWVTGTSASGKETFMNKLLNDSQLQQQFGWQNKAIAVCPESIDHIGQFENDPVVDLREQIIDSVRQLLVQADAVLVKWQFVDTQADRLKRLKESTPSARHRVIQLQASAPDLIDRLKQKPWWDDHGNEAAFIQAELDLVANCMTKLTDNFNFTYVDSGQAGQYRLIA